MTKWSTDPSQKAASISITGSGLVATKSGTAQAAMVRADLGSVPLNSDDWYCEFTINARTPPTTNFSDVGLGVSSAGTNVDTNFDRSSVGYFSDGWASIYGGPYYTGVTYGAGDIIGMRKRSNGLFFTKNGVAAYAETLNAAGLVYPTAVLFYNGDQVTANFGQSAFSYFPTSPAGATAWSVDPTTLPAINIAFSKTLPSVFHVIQITSTGASELPTTPVFGTGGFFPDTIAAILSGRTVRADLLVFFDFVGIPMRLWQGFGALQTLDGNIWEGIGQLGSISDLESSIGGTSPTATFSLSLVDPTMLADALNAEDVIYGRAVKVYMQIFNADFTPLDNPYVVYAGIMDQIHVKQQMTESGEVIQVDVTAETIFARRTLPPLGNLTDREQQKLYRDDRGLVLIPSLTNKTAIWPVILPES